MANISKAKNINALNAGKTLTSSFRLDTRRTQLGDGWPGRRIPAAPRAAAVGVTPASGIPVKGMPAMYQDHVNAPLRIVTLEFFFFGR